MLMVAAKATVVCFPRLRPRRAFEAERPRGMSELATATAPACAFSSTAPAVLSNVSAWHSN